MGTKNSILFRVGAREESFVAMMGRLLTAVRSSCGCTYVWEARRRFWKVCEAIVKVGVKP